MHNRKSALLIFGGLLLASMMYLPAAYGQATTWSYTENLDPDGSGHLQGNGMMVRSATHSGNTIVDRSTLPYIVVSYGDGGPPIYDHFPFDTCQFDCWGKTNHHEKHTFTGGEYWHGIFFVGCQVWTETTNGCYKYEQQYWFYNTGITNGTPEMEFWLRAWGPGYIFTRGQPTNYDVYWRVDTDVKGSSLDKYERYTTSWVEWATEGNTGTIGTTDSGIEWRTYDTGTGNGVSKRINIWPVTGDFEQIWFLRFKGTKSVPTEYDSDPESFDNDVQSLSSQDDLIWYKTNRPGSECIPTSPCSQVFIFTLTGL
jgi:hypothetical protein